MPTTSPPSAEGEPIEAPKPTPKTRWPAVGDFNVLEASIGKKGMGKSTHQAYRALQLQRETGAYVIGHSLGQRLPEQLPDAMGGARLPITYHRDLVSLDRGLRAKPERWHVLAPPLPQEGGPPDPDTADDLMEYSIRLSAAVRERAFREKHPLRSLVGKGNRRYLGLRCPPIVVILDEGIAVSGAATGDAATGEKNRWFLQYVYSLRHLHVALLYAIQEPTSRSWRVMEAATSIHVFRLDHRWSLDAVNAAGATAEQTELIARLPPYEKITLR